MKTFTGLTILNFIRGVVDMEHSELITNEFRAYNVIGRQMKHAVINH